MFIYFAFSFHNQNRECLPVMGKHGTHNKNNLVLKINNMHVTAMHSNRWRHHRFVGPIRKIHSKLVKEIIYFKEACIFLRAFYFLKPIFEGMFYKNPL